MAHASVKIYAPSRPLTLFFLVLLVPVCLWGLDMSGFALLGTLLGMWSGALAVSLLCGMAILLPMPFALRGVRAAMIPPVLALLFSVLSVLQPRFGGDADYMLLLLFGLGGICCVMLSYLFRRARPLLAALDRGRLAPSWLMGLATLPITMMGIALALIDPWRHTGFWLCALLFTGALPGLLLPRFRALCACAGLVYVIAVGCIFGRTFWAGFTNSYWEFFSALVISPVSAGLLLCLALWLDWRPQRKETE